MRLLIALRLFHTYRQRGLSRRTAVTRAWRYAA